MRGSTKPWKVREQQLAAFALNKVHFLQQNISSPTCPQFAPRPSNPDVCAYCSSHRLAHPKESGQLQPKELERTRFTEDQVREMRSFAENKLHWSTKMRDRPDLIAQVDSFCRRIKVEVPKFKTWVLNNKKKYRGSSSAPPPLLQLMPVEHHPSSSSAPPPALPAPLQPKLE